MDNESGVDVLVVDDHRIVLQGICSLFASCESIRSIDQAVTGEEAVAKNRRRKFGVIVLDVELPDMSGLELLEQLRRQSPDASFVFHTMHDEMWIVKQMMATGADGIVLKGDSVEELTAAVTAVAQGDCYYSRRYEAYCRRFESQQVPSAREMEVLRAIAAGKSTREIADSLFISTNTVEFHRKRLMRKLGAANMADMMIKAVEKGLLAVNY